MATYSREPDYVFQGVEQENFWSEKFMEEHL